MENMDLAIDFQCAGGAICLFYVSRCEFHPYFLMRYLKRIASLITGIREANWENVGRD